MGTEGAFDHLAIDEFWTGPSFWCAEDDHWPNWSSRVVILSSVLLNGFDLLDAGVGGLGHRFMHLHWIVAFDEVWFPAHAAEIHDEFIMWDAAKDGWVRDFVAVEVEDWENRTIGDWVEELVALPGSGKRTSLSFAITNDDSGNQIWVIKDGTEAMGDGIAKLAAFVD